ncbi:hypothetical protein N9A28_07850 [Sulfurimonas sp.]|nr:hypothetical protein [Sulfurimonas sp.]
MSYFSKVKLEQEVFSLVYGHGEVIFVLPKEQRIDGFYVFAAKFSKKNIIHYTVEGFPNWSPSNGACQTVFYQKDLDMNDIDILPVSKELSEKQILKYAEKDILEMRCPSGIWRNVNECPQNLMKKALKKDKLYLFRKEKYKGLDRRQ